MFPQISQVRLFSRKANVRAKKPRPYQKLLKPRSNDPVISYYTLAKLTVTRSSEIFCMELLSGNQPLLNQELRQCVSLRKA